MKRDGNILTTNHDCINCSMIPSIRYLLTNHKIPCNFTFILSIIPRVASVLCRWRPPYLLPFPKVDFIVSCPLLPSQVGPMSTPNNFILLLFFFFWGTNAFFNSHSDLVKPQGLLAFKGYLIMLKYKILKFYIFLFNLFLKFYIKLRIH